MNHTESSAPRPSTQRRAARMPGIGDTVDERYELLRDLGRGGAGTVFEARHVYTRRIVAVKILHADKDGATLAALKARLLREAQALATVCDPGIVDVLDAGLDGNAMPFLVLERLEGRTRVGLIVARGKLPVTDTVAIGLQLARSLAAAHRAVVVHRDVKPSNIFIIRDVEGRERTKLVDFGIARVDRVAGCKLTTAGAPMGTPEYMSHEQLMAQEDLDARIDVYGLGVTLFECLTGDVPYSGSYPEILLKSAVARSTPSLHDAAPEIPIQIARVIDRALAKARDDRFPDMDSFAAALDASAPSSRKHSVLLGPPPIPVAVIPPSRHATPVGPIDFAQKRRSPRAAYVTPIRMLVDGATVDGRSEDISENGMLILCRGELPINHPIDIRFASPIDGRVVTLRGHARWVKKTGREDHAQRAIGLQFEGVPEEVLRSIRQYAEMMQDPARRDSAGFSVPPAR